MLKHRVELLGISESYPETVRVCEAQEPAPERGMKVKNKVVGVIFENLPESSKRGQCRPSSSDKSPACGVRITCGGDGDEDYFINRGIAPEYPLESLLNDPADKTRGIMSLERMHQRESVDHIPERAWFHDKYAFFGKIHKLSFILSFPGSALQGL
jgi:hypothetical protein